MNNHIVLFGGKYPVKFHSNVRGKVYSCVREDEATQFPAPELAAAAATDHKIELKDFSVQKLVAPNAFDDLFAQSKTPTPNIGPK